MAAAMHHSIHMPSLSRTAQGLEKVVGAVLVTILAPLTFALVMLSGLLLALAVSKLL
jgi:hypothetical protein